LNDFVLITLIRVIVEEAGTEKYAHNEKVSLNTPNTPLIGASKQKGSI